jgi:hypothetical protein
MGRLLAAAVLAALIALPGAARCGEVGDTLGEYSSAGAGVGAVLGAAAATLPYLQNKQPFDYLTGAGIGLVAGCGIGFCLGIVDLANKDDDAMGPRPGLSVAWGPTAVTARYTVRF